MRHMSAKLPVTIFLLLGITGVIIAGIIGYSLKIGIRMSQTYVPLTDAIMEIKAETVTAHLVLEEILSGERKEEDLELVWKHLDRADQHAKAMIEGRTDDTATLLPLEDPAIRREIVAVQAELMEFRQIAQHRFQSKETTGNDADVYRRFHAIFLDFLAHVDKVEQELQRLTAGELSRFRLVQENMMALCLIAAFAAGIVFYIYERQRTRYFRSLREE